MVSDNVQEGVIKQNGEYYAKVPSYNGKPLLTKVVGPISLGHEEGHWVRLTGIAPIKGRMITVTATVKTVDGIDLPANASRELMVRAREGKVEVFHQGAELSGRPINISLQYTPL
jgi:hypothetical protein